MTDTLYTFTPEEREAADALVEKLRTFGRDITPDEAMLAANISHFVAGIIGEDSNARSRATRHIAESSALGQACSVLLAQAIVRQHRLDFEGDINLRTLDLLQTLVPVIAKLTDRKLRHPGG